MQKHRAHATGHSPAWRRCQSVAAVKATISVRRASSSTTSSRFSIGHSLTGCGARRPPNVRRCSPRALPHRRFERGRITLLAGEALAQELEQPVHRRQRLVLRQRADPADELAHRRGAGRRRTGEAERLLALGMAEFDRDRPLREAVAEVDLGVASAGPWDWQRRAPPDRPRCAPGGSRRAAPAPAAASRMAVSATSGARNFMHSLLAMGRRLNPSRRRRASAASRRRAARRPGRCRSHSPSRADGVRSPR